MRQVAQAVWTTTQLVQAVWTIQNPALVVRTIERKMDQPVTLIACIRILGGKHYLTEVFHSFPQAVQKRQRQKLKVGHDRFPTVLPNHFMLHTHSLAVFKRTNHTAYC